MRSEKSKKQSKMQTSLIDSSSEIQCKRTPGQATNEQAEESNLRLAEGTYARILGLVEQEERQRISRLVEGSAFRRKLSF